MLLLHFPVAVASDLPSIDTPVRSGQRHVDDAAVVIGIEDYFRVPDVPHARRDAEAFRDFLVYTRGVPSDRVTLLVSDVNREAIEAAVAKLGSQVGSGGTAWVYYAGHGAASPYDARRLLLGDDVATDPSLFEKRSIGVDEVRTLATGGGHPLVLVVDACYAGTGRSGAQLFGGTRFAVPTYARQTSTEVLEWSATQGGELAAPLAAVEHGAFTYFAIRALQGQADGELSGEADGKVTAEEAQLYVERLLRGQGLSQRPAMATESSSGWVLSSGKLAAPVPAAAPVVPVPVVAPAPAPEAQQIPTRVVVRSSQINILEKVYFGEGEAKLPDQADGVLAEIVGIAPALEGHTIRLEGHARPGGSAAEALVLSRARAQAVAERLEALGMPTELISGVHGFGAERPVDAAASAKNDRVEFVVVGVGP